jgi:hypothetical protein
MPQKKDVEALRNCLIMNAEHPTSLSLGLGDWQTADDLWFNDHRGIVEDGTRTHGLFATYSYAPSAAQ